MTLLLSRDSQLLGHLFGVKQFHFFGVGSIEVIQVKLLARSVHLISGKFFLFLLIFLVKLGQSFEFSAFYFMIPVFKLLLVSCTGENRGLLLDHFHAFLVNLRLKGRCRSCSVCIAIWGILGCLSSHTFTGADR